MQYGGFMDLLELGKDLTLMEYIKNSGLEYSEVVTAINSYKNLFKAPSEGDRYVSTDGREWRYENGSWVQWYP